jgi:hypothetical protein
MSIKNKKNGLEVYVYNPTTGKNQYVGRFPDTREGRRQAQKAEADAAQRFRGEDPTSVTGLRSSAPSGGSSKTIHVVGSRLLLP